MPSQLHLHLAHHPKQSLSYAYQDLESTLSLLEEYLYPNPVEKERKVSTLKLNTEWTQTNFKVLHAYNYKPYSTLSSNQLHYSPSFLSMIHIQAWNKMIILSRLNEKPAETGNSKYENLKFYKQDDDNKTILTLIMGVVNSTIKDGTFSSDGQNE